MLRFMREDSFIFHVLVQMSDGYFVDDHFSFVSWKGLSRVLVSWGWCIPHVDRFLVPFRCPPPAGVGDAILLDYSYPLSTATVWKHWAHCKPFMPPRNNISSRSVSSCGLMSLNEIISNCDRSTVCSFGFEARVCGVQRVGLW